MDYEILQGFESEFNVVAKDYNLSDNTFIIDYDDFDDEMVYYLEEECIGYNIEYYYEIDDNTKICRFKIIKRKKEISENRQIFLNNISNNIENQMIDLELEDYEIEYICNNIKNHLDMEE